MDLTALQLLAQAVGLVVVARLILVVVLATLHQLRHLKETMAGGQIQVVLNFLAAGVEEHLLLVGREQQTQQVLVAMELHQHFQALL